MRWRDVVAGIVAVMLSAATAFCVEALDVGAFSKGSPGGTFPDGWEAMTFRKIKAHSHYTLESDRGTVVVKAESEGGASGMIRKLSLDPNQWPVITWRWKVSGVYEKGDATTKRGDDYPARIYVTFAFDPEHATFTERLKFNAAKAIHGEYPPGTALNYIWASKLPAGSILPNAYTHRAMMIAVQSGPENAGTWITETRNILNDYKQAFGTTPPPISGIAIMTDADNTGESATAWYGNIQLLKDN